MKRFLKRLKALSLSITVDSLNYQIDFIIAPFSWHIKFLPHNDYYSTGLSLGLGPLYLDFTRLKENEVWTG